MAKKSSKKEVLTLEEKLEKALVPVEEQPYAVPENWVWTRLGDISEIVTKGTTPKGGANAYKETGIGFLRIENISDDGYVNRENIKFIDENTHNVELKRSILKSDDILITIAGTLGKIGIVRETDLPLNMNQAVSVVRFKNTNTFESKYFRFAVLSPIINNYILKKSKVTAIPNLTLEIIRETIVPLPPLAEQTRIVSRIESLFSKLDEARERIESSLNRFEERKSAILHKAFSGELTKKWREENGSKAWKIVGIEELVQNSKNALKAGPFGSSLKKSFYVENGYKVYGQEQVISGNETIGDYYITEDKYNELNSCKIAPCDVLISLVGTVGKVLVLSSDCKSGIINPRLIKVSLNRQLMLPYFFKYYFESDYLKMQYSNETHGSTMDVLNMKIFKKLPFPLVDLPEQEEIVRLLDNILGKETQAKEFLSLLEKIDLMKKAILGRAFRGELGTNDPLEESAQGLLREVFREG